MWRQKIQEERKMLNEFWVSRSNFGLTVIQTPITLCNKLSPHLVSSNNNHLIIMPRSLWVDSVVLLMWAGLGENHRSFLSLSCAKEETGGWLAGLGWPQLTRFPPVCILSHSKHVQVCFHDCQARSKHENGLWRVSFCTGMVLHPWHSPGQNKWLD